jgi:CRP-like cAMP-binding protein
MITIRQYAPGEPIIKEHEPGECAYLIEKGRVEITKEKDGRQTHVAFLEAGMTFGEMSMVDDLPRSATVTAVEETLVREVHRDKLYEMLKSNPETMSKLLKGIFERLRIANTTIARLKEDLRAAQEAKSPVKLPGAPAGSGPARPASEPLPFVNRPAPGGAKAYRIEGLTPRAIEAIPDNPFTFTALPFKIGRKSNDPMVNNHLEIADRDPLQISRHHVSIVQEGGRVGVVDRGSQLGALVDDQRIGGKKHGPGPAFFKGDEGVLVLGTDTSPYRYKLTIIR